MIHKFLTRAAAASATLLLAVSLSAQQAPPSDLSAAIAANPAAGIAGIPGTYVITNATIVPVSGPRIERGSVVISNGTIAAVGASVRTPAGAKEIDGTGLFVYPGFIDSGTQLGLTEIGSVPGPTDLNEVGDYNPNDRAIVAVNPHSELIPVARANGITTAITAPQGGVVSGQAALIDLAGWTPTGMAARESAGMVMTYPRAGRRRRFGPSGSDAERRQAMNRQVRELYAFLEDAREYAAVADARRQNMEPGDHVNLVLQSMVPVMRGEVPAIFDVDTEEQIRGVLALADSFHIKVVLRGAAEAWKVRNEIAQHNIPVIVGPLTRAPDSDAPYDAIYANPGALVSAGVTIAFQSDDAADVRNLPYQAALATAFGLDPQAAIRALTINPATIWGVSDRYGSLQPGKVANVIVTTGDPLDVRSTVKYLFIRGALVPFTDKHTELYQQFRARPRPAGKDG